MDRLSLSNTSLTLLHATQHWVLLQSLDLSHNRLASLAGLSFLANMQDLNLDHNCIASISPRDFAGWLVGLVGWLVSWLDSRSRGILFGFVILKRLLDGQVCKA
jgi:hypothetical protein